MPSAEILLTGNVDDGGGARGVTDSGQDEDRAPWWICFHDPATPVWPSGWHLPREDALRMNDEACED